MVHARSVVIGFGLLVAGSVAACSGDDGGPPPGAAVLTAWEETGDQVFTEHPIDLTCYQTPSSDVASTVAIAFTTRVNDFQTPERDVVGAEVIAFANVDFAAPFAAAAISDANGMVTVTLPPGQKRVGFKMHEPEMYYDTSLLNQYFDPGMP